MAETDPLLDEALTDEDRRTVDAIEAPTPQSEAGPEPVDLDEINPPPAVSPPLDLTPPEIGSEGPTRQEPLPGMPPPAAPPVPAALSEDIAKRQGEQDKAKAAIDAATAQRMAQEAQAADEDARLERADYLQRRKAAEDDLNARVKQYEQAHIVNPRNNVSTKSRLAVIFGGLGAAYRSAGGGSSENRMLDQLQKGWDDDTAIQKANIAALRDSTVMARTKLDDIEAGRRQMLRDADARLLSKYNLALKQGEAQLKGQGATQAEIDADARIVKLRQAQAAAKIQTQKDEDAHQLNQARIARLNAQAARDQRKAKGGGAGAGGVSTKEQRALDKEERKNSLHALDKLPGDFKTDLAENGIVAGQGGAKGLLPVNRQLQKLLKAVDSDNPLSAKEAFLAFDSAARGGTATQGSVEELKKTLGGTFTQIENWFEAKSSGGLAPAAKQRFRDAIVEAIGSNVSAAGDGHQTMVDKYFAPDYYGIKQNVEGQFGVFSGFRDANGKQVFGVQRDKAAPGVSRTTGRRLPTGGGAPPTTAKPEPSPDEKLAAARRVRDDPKAPAAARQNAIDYIKARANGG